MDRGASWATDHGMAKRLTLYLAICWPLYRPHACTHTCTQTRTCMLTKPSRTHCSFHCSSNGAWSSGRHPSLEKLAKASLKRRDGASFSSSCRHERKGAFEGRELRVESGRQERAQHLPATANPTGVLVSGRGRRWRMGEGGGGWPQRGSRWAGPHPPRPRLSHLAAAPNDDASTFSVLGDCCSWYYWDSPFPFSLTCFQLQAKPLAPLRTDQTTSVTCLGSACEVLRDGGLLEASPCNHIAVALCKLREFCKCSCLTR